MAMDFGVAEGGGMEFFRFGRGDGNGFYRKILSLSVGVKFFRQRCLIVAECDNVGLPLFDRAPVPQLAVSGSGLVHEAALAERSKALRESVFRSALLDCLYHAALCDRDDEPRTVRAGFTQKKPVPVMKQDRKSTR